MAGTADAIPACRGSCSSETAMNTSGAPFKNPVAHRRLGVAASAALGAAGLLAASAAQAGTGELAAQTVQGVLAFFADPENVRGVFGAAAGALASVLAARPLTRRSDGGSDDT
jgi:hypothetical protein